MQFYPPFIEQERLKARPNEARKLRHRSGFQGVTNVLGFELSLRSSVSRSPQETRCLASLASLNLSSIGHFPLLFALPLPSYLSADFSICFFSFLCFFPYFFLSFFYFFNILLHPYPLPAAQRLVKHNYGKKLWASIYLFTYI